MSEAQAETTESTPVAPPAQQAQVAIRDADLAVLYANFFRVTGNSEEVLIDLGMFSQVVTPTGPEPVNMTHRVVINFVTAKKLAEVMRVVVARHEQAFGQIEVDPARRMRNPSRL
jgi:hypothetical protein